jgi:NAD(P)H-dependent FMN reductase
MKNRIGIILGSTREGRVSPQVGSWVKQEADKRGYAEYEIVDIKDFNLPFLGTTEDTTAAKAWNAKLSEFDGFIFVVSEYNHGMSGALKNALDSAKDPWHNKAAALVSYGSGYGIRAHETLRLVLSELQIAHVRTPVQLSLFTDFENFTTFKPQAIHQDNLDGMLTQLDQWTNAMNTVRK